MSFVVDTDICSAYLKGDGRVFNKFIQHGGGLFVSSVTAGELWTWAYRKNAPARRLQGLIDFFADIPTLVVDHAIAERFGQIRALLLDQGIHVPTADLLIATSALFHNFTLVTNNEKHYAQVPGLRVENWLK